MLAVAVVLDRLTVQELAVQAATVAVALVQGQIIAMLQLLERPIQGAAQEPHVIAERQEQGVLESQ
jgi:hypothetical protein